jgi:O-antigen/teichoic acid export membrane protein
VLVYEVGKSDTASQQYGRIFRHAALGTAWVLLAASLCARPLIYLLASPEYEHAADVIPVVCLAYWLYSLHEHFKTPILLHARTAAILPIYVVAGTVNVGLNLLLIPRFGAMGAAWASVVAFAVFSFGGFLLYRRIRRFEYPLRRCLALVGAMVATFIGVRTFALTSIAAELIVGVIVSIVWFAMLFPALIGEGLSRLNRWKSQRNERAMSVHP